MSDGVDHMFHQTWAIQQAFFISSALHVGPFLLNIIEKIMVLKAIEDDNDLQNCSPFSAFPYADDLSAIPMEYPRYLWIWCEIRDFGLEQF